MITSNNEINNDIDSQIQDEIQPNSEYENISPNTKRDLSERNPETQSHEDSTLNILNDMQSNDKVLIINNIIYNDDVLISL